MTHTFAPPAGTRKQPRRGQRILIACDAEPRHPYLYYEYDPDQWYPPPCPDCCYATLQEAHAPCEHSHHRRYRRAKWFREVGGWLYQLGVSSGGCFTMSAHCRGCYTIYWRGKRCYVLGAAKDTWRCWLKGHRVGDPIGFGMCSKCLPCPECGSKTAGHIDGCAAL